MKINIFKFSPKNTCEKWHTPKIPPQTGWHTGHKNSVIQILESQKIVRAPVADKSQSIPPVAGIISTIKQK